MATNPQLSPAQRAFMADPEKFRKRMKERAERLWSELYTVAPTDEIGVFIVTTPTETKYPVNVLAQTCACVFQQKGEIPEVPCKHLQGLGELVESQLAFLKMRATIHQEKAGPLNSSAERAEQLWKQFFALQGAWVDAQMEAQAQEHDRQEADAECATGCDPFAEF